MKVVFWVYLTASTMLFVSGTIYVRQYGITGSLLAACGAAISLVIANIIYAEALAMRMVTASIFSSTSCLLGMVLVGSVYFGERVTLLHALALACAIAAAILVVLAEGGAA